MAASGSGMGGNAPPLVTLLNIMSAINNKPSPWPITGQQVTTPPIAPPSPVTPNPMNTPNSGQWTPPYMPTPPQASSPVTQPVMGNTGGKGGGMTGNGGDAMMTIMQLLRNGQQR